MACMECRLAKTRCIIPTSSRPLSPQTICERCERHQFCCLFVETKRGRKAKSKLPPSLTRASTERNPISNGIIASDTSKRPGLNTSCPADYDSQQTGKEVVQIPYDDLIVNRCVTLGDLLRPIPSPSAATSTGRSTSLTSDTRNVYSYDQMDLDDPVTSGLISEDAARALFAFFMEHMIRWSNLLDKRLHTHDFVRQRSSFLYVAILSTASKFSLDPSEPEMTLWCAGLVPRPPSHVENRKSVTSQAGSRLRQLLYVLCQDLAARAFADGEERSVECCQAFILTSCWRSMQDGVGTLQFGFALRLGCDLRLDAELPNEGLDLDDRTCTARQWGYRNRQRTFLVLFIMDKAQQIVNDLDTRAIPYNHRLLSQATDWYQGQRAALGDGLLCACVEFRKVQDKYVSLLRDLGHASSNASAKAERSWLLDAILADLNDCESRWQTALSNSTKAVEEDTGCLQSSGFDSSSALRMLQFWTNSISLHLCCSLLALQRDDNVNNTASLGDSPDSDHSAPDTRASRVLKFWSARRRAPGNEEEEIECSLAFIPPLLHLAAAGPIASRFDSILVYHCTASAQGVLDALSRLPPLRLRTTPDPTILQCLHAATVLASAALSTNSITKEKSRSSYLSTSSSSAESAFSTSVYRLISTMRDNCASASLSTEDTVHHVAEYMESLLVYMRENEGDKHHPMQ